MQTQKWLDIMFRNLLVYILVFDNFPRSHDDLLISQQTFTSYAAALELFEFFVSKRVPTLAPQLVVAALRAQDQPFVLALGARPEAFFYHEAFEFFGRHITGYERGANE
ncbi:MAG: hypothetical protein HZA59_00365 [Hydrogenophilales bacterium]|nr:hypothetical protein [Hydrogenophilales bacterium]